jgi:hypothetical protein
VDWPGASAGTTNASISGNWSGRFSCVPCGQLPISSIKVEVKKKHISNSWSFSCFAAHLFEQDLF